MFSFYSGRLLIVAVVFSCTLGVGVVGVLAGAMENAQIKSRQDKLRDMGGALKSITDDIKRGRLDWENTIATNTQTIKDRSGYLLNWFPKGSGPESGVKTYALTAIWQKNDEFVKLGKAAQAEAIKLDQLAATKNADAFKAQVIATGKACKSCHDAFRSPDYEKENDN